MYHELDRMTYRLFLATICLSFLTPAACKSAEPLPRSPRTGEANVAPDINQSYREDDFDADEWVPKFEQESREIYANRHELVKQLAAKPGMAVADIGAGTGFMTLLFAEAVQPEGRVYAVDITPGFLKMIDAKVAERKLTNVETVLCTPDSVELPSASIDLAFICDTYHHFEYPRSTMTTLHQALKPGGEVVIVDFIRIPGKSRQWVIDHVRDGQDVFIREIESCGFELLSRGDDVPYLKENYAMRFRKTEREGKSADLPGWPTSSEVEDANSAS